MRRIAALIGLTLVLSGPLLRESEAASDYARTHSVQHALAGVLDEPDGGVGDDAGEATLKSSSAFGGTASAIRPPCDLPGAIDTLSAFSHQSPFSPGPDARSRQRGREIPLLATSHRRLAWLQLFLL